MWLKSYFVASTCDTKSELLTKKIQLAECMKSTRVRKWAKYLSENWFYTHLDEDEDDIINIISLATNIPEQKKIKDLLR